MTHEARAKAIVKALPSLSWRELQELIHKALIAACNDELERRREVEMARDRAMRLQASLELYAAWLEGVVKGLANTLEPVLAARLGDPITEDLHKQLAMAAELLQEFADGQEVDH
jgi:hypothetical protein